MGKIKKILEKELGSTQSVEVYPVTSIKAVYDENNERLDNIINRKNKEIQKELEAEVTRASNAESNLRETINNITEINENATSANIVTIDTIPNTSSSNVQQALNELFKNATFAGIATPTTNPGTPDGPVFYIATTAGNYSNFGNIEVLKGETAIIKWNNGTYTKNAIKPMTDFNSVFDANGRSLTHELNILDSNISKLEEKTKNFIGDTTSDFSISDTFGREIVKFDDGHIETKNFNSKELKEHVNSIQEEIDVQKLVTPTVEHQDSLEDLSITDPDGNVLVKFENGHIKTKNFDSSELTPTPVHTEVADYSYYKHTNYSYNYNKPIICFSFDCSLEYFDEDDVNEFFDYCDSLGLKITIASSSTTGFKNWVKDYDWFNKIKKGHDIISYQFYRPPINPNVGDFGFGSEDEYTTTQRYVGQNKAFDELGIKRNISIWANASKITPSAISITHEFYENIIGNIKYSGVMDFADDSMYWGRIKMEDKSFVDMKAIVESNLSKAKVIMFGTHIRGSIGIMSNRTHWENEVKPFLRYISEIVNVGLAINVSATHALDIVHKYVSVHNIVPFKIYSWIVKNGEQFKKNIKVGSDVVTKHYIVSDEGNAAIFKLNIAGSSTTGTIKLTLDSTTTQLRQYNIIEETCATEEKIIEVTSGMTAADVANLFYTHAFYSNYRVKVVGESVYFYRCRTDNSDVTFEITENTSGVSITKEQILESKNQILIEL